MRHFTTRCFQVSLSLAAFAAADDLPLATPAADLQVAEGFQVDLLYAVPKEEQGSWVGVTVDARGRLITTDQYGGLYRITLPDTSSTDATAAVEPLPITLPDTPIGAEWRRDEFRDSIIGAHGLLYAFDSLYVMVSENHYRQGIWRLRDTDGDDQFDQFEHLQSLEGGGEHGPHSLVLGPAGKMIYVIAGNFTELPAGLDATRPKYTGEDHLLPRMWDARGHARGRYAPGGWVARMDPEGKAIELFAQGFRNQFDASFDANGELFTFDSDMEWDIGTPWYMPTRINHIVNAGDYGWRSGAGRWPAYYPDSLPAVIDIGPSSPTGTVFGTGAKFPARYQRALFAADWTYGTLYAIHLQPDGASFTGEKEEFVAGKPLPLTDIIVNPHDGAFYFLVGGRRTQSALYRVTYVGDADTSPAPAIPPTPEAKLRHEIEALQADGTHPDAIDEVWPHLGHSDRFIRWAARTVLENQLPSNWAYDALSEREPTAAVEALIGFARVAPDRYQRDIIAALKRWDFAALSPDLQRNWLRALQLTFTRMGPPPAEEHAALLELMDPWFPGEDPMVNRMLVETLVYLDSPTIVAKTVPLLKIAEPTGTEAESLGTASLIARNDRYASAFKRAAEARPDRQQIAYAYALRHATVGWTPAVQREFFEWFPTTRLWKGGASFKGFLANIRTEALANVNDPGERAELAELSKEPVHEFVPGAIPPEGPGEIYTIDSALEKFAEPLKEQNFLRGESMFAATACVACHRFGDIGGGMGPDITGAGNRYSVRDLLENIIEPSKVISDIYEAEQFVFHNGNVVVGRMIEEFDDAYSVMVNPFAPDQLRRVGKDQLAERKPYPVSLMPAGLVNGLNRDELRDLVAYLISGGNPADPMFSSSE